MNIEEAKKLIDKQSIGKGGVGDIPVVKTHIVKVLLDQIDQPQPEVPRFVADWYEKHKDSLECDLYLYHMSIYDEEVEKDDFYYWMQTSKNPVYTLINMHQFGYTIQKEKLYTVEIPNPNERQLSFVLMRQLSGN
ncbi:phage protein [Streptococcus agalactiae]|nr:phage protein [Streptococcus agalactiae]